MFTIEDQGIIFDAATAAARTADRLLHVAVRAALGRDSVRLSERAREACADQHHPTVPLDGWRGDVGIVARGVRKHILTEFLDRWVRRSWSKLRRAVAVVCHLV